MFTFIFVGLLLNFVYKRDEINVQLLKDFEKLNKSSNSESE